MTRTVVQGLPLSFVVDSNPYLLIARLVKQLPGVQCRGLESHLGQFIVVGVIVFTFDRVDDSHTYTK